MIASLSTREQRSVSQLTHASMSLEPDFTWIVPTTSELGRRLASFSDADWEMFREHVALVRDIDIEVTEETEPRAERNRVYFDGPAFVMTVRHRPLGIINDIEEIARPITPPAMD